MRASIRQRDRCRLCGSAAMHHFLRFDDVPFTDELLRPGEEGTEFLAPLEVYWCAACTAVQTLHDVAVADYYRDYRYTVSSSPTARRFMKLLAETAGQYFGLEPGDRVLEVGSGDGHQLTCFQALGAQVLGYEPGTALARDSLAAGVPVIPRLFGHDSLKDIPAEMVPLQVVLLTYTFDHLPEPTDFLAAARQVLDPKRGVLIIEIHDFEKLWERCEVCLFAHEHSIYLTLAALTRCLNRAGFRVVTAELLPEAVRRGNSLLVAATLQDSLVPGCVDAEAATLPRFRELATYRQFAETVASRTGHLRDHVRRGREAGRRFGGYGGSGRGVLTIAMSGLDARDLIYVLDRNPGFNGLLMPKSHIPVYSPPHLREAPVDELIVFSFGYFDEIKAQLAALTPHLPQLISVLDLLC